VCDHIKLINKYRKCNKSTVDISADVPVELTVCYAGWNETGWAVLR